MAVRPGELGCLPRLMCRGLRTVFGIASAWTGQLQAAITLLAERLFLNALFWGFCFFRKQNIMAEELAVHLHWVYAAVSRYLSDECGCLLHELLILQLFEHLQADGVSDELDIFSLSKVLEVLEVVLELGVCQETSFFEN